MDIDRFIENVNKKREGAWREMYRKYYPAMCNYASKIVKDTDSAEDIVQDVMLKVWRDEKGKVENLAAYCYTMARNLALNRLVLKDNRSKELEGAYEQEVQEQPLENIIRTEKMKLLYQMIDGLPGLQRDVVQLRDMEGLSYRDIAKTLQVTEEQVKVNLFRARKKIKTWILNMENYGL